MSEELGKNSTVESEFHSTYTNTSCEKIASKALNPISIDILQITPLSVASHAIRTCWSSHDKGDRGGPKDLELIDRVGNKLKHASTLEHIYYTFFISGISRGCLMELTRHRLVSYSVKSSRYTLKELLGKKREGNDLAIESNLDYSKYLVQTGNALVDKAAKSALDSLVEVLRAGVGNDLAKYCMPESFKTELTLSINARSLQNLLALRSSKAALWEIRNLAHAIFYALPEEHRFLYEELMDFSENRSKK